MAAVVTRQMSPHVSSHVDCEPVGKIRDDDVAQFLESGIVGLERLSEDGTGAGQDVEVEAGMVSSEPVSTLRVAEPCVLDGSPASVGQHLQEADVARVEASLHLRPELDDADGGSTHEKRCGHEGGEPPGRPFRSGIRTLHIFDNDRPGPLCDVA